MVGLYPSIPHEEGLQALKRALDEREDKSVSTESLIELAQLVLKNSYILSIVPVFLNKIRLPRLAPSSPHHMLFCLWLRLKRRPIKSIIFNRGFGGGILMMFF